MPYRAHLVFDFGNGYNGNEFQRMESALINLQWTYVETSAFMFQQPAGMSDADALRFIWQGMATLARATAAIGGVMSALNFNIQRLDPAKMGQTTFGGATNPANSYTTISVEPFPGDAQPGN